MKKKRVLFLIVLSMALSIIICSCGGGNGEDKDRLVMCYINGEQKIMYKSACLENGGTVLPDPDVPDLPISWDISGNWKFYLVSDGIESKSFNLVLEQSGTDFNGVYSDYQTDTNINGTFTDSNVSFMTIDKSFSFTGVVNVNTMSGTWVAINGTSSGTWRADRSEELNPQ